MNDAILDRWARMWPRLHHPEYPWWVAREVSGMTLAVHPPIHSAMWVRSDGADGPSTRTREGAALDLCTDDLARIDRKHPLPRPPIMAGQVWAWVRAGVLHERVIWAVQLAPGIEPEPAADVLPEDAALVYGPSIYGANTPWSPS